MAQPLTNGSPLDPYQVSLPAPVPKGEPAQGELTWKNWIAPTPFLNTDPLTPRSAQQLSSYDKIALNPVVKFALEAREQGVFATNWEIHAMTPRDGDPLYLEMDRRITDWINEQIEGLWHESFTNRLRALYRDGPRAGCAIGEMVPWDGHPDGITRIVDIDTRRMFNFQMYSDRVGNPQKLQFLTTGQWIQPEDLWRFVIAPYPFLANGNWLGQSDLQSVRLLVEEWELLNEFMVRGSAELSRRLVIHYFRSENRDSNEFSAVQAAVNSVDKAKLIRLKMNQPIGDSTEPDKEDILEVMDNLASPEGVGLIKDAIKIAEDWIKRALGIPDDIGFGGDGVGSYAKSKTEMNMFWLKVAQDQEYVRNFVNRQIIPTMVRFRFPALPRGYKLPQLVFVTEESDYQSGQTDDIIKLIQSGVVTADEPWIRERLNIPAAPQAETLAKQA